MGRKGEEAEIHSEEFCPLKIPRVVVLHRVFFPFPGGRGGVGGSDGGPVGSLLPDWVSPPRGCGLSQGGGSQGTAVPAIISASPIVDSGVESHVLGMNGRTLLLLPLILLMLLSLRVLG